MQPVQPIPLSELTRRLGAAVATAPGTHEVWVTAETSDVRTSGGHCYMELIEKHPQTGATTAKIRAAIWASRYAAINFAFLQATGSPLTSGIKILACVSASLHQVYGLSLVVSDINPEYTMGDLVRRRNEMLMRLQHEGVIEMNRHLPWPVVPQRIAVISALGAAGYGDFIHQLYTNPRHLNFRTELFTAVLQGERAPASIIAALEAIALREDEFDCVVIIRGGGATSDLVSLDNYDLANNVAQFPLPVIVGVGHERDITILDYVANMRVKTPTAAAEWLIARGNDQLNLLSQLTGELFRAVTERVSGERHQLAFYRGQLPPLAMAVIDRNRQWLQSFVRELPPLINSQLERQRNRLATMRQVLEALSPQATLSRGYTITRVDGRIATSATAIGEGRQVTTVFADGAVTYTPTNLKPNAQ